MNGKMSQKHDEESSDEGYGNSPYYDAQSKLFQHKKSETSFSRILQKWLPERRNTLTKLRLLLKEVHDEALKFNETQASFKQLSFNSRTLKSEVENGALQFFSSLGALIGDVASGITAAAEACNVDSYQTKLQEILDHDTKITKELYSARSQCMTKYQGIEEVIRNPSSETLTTTIDKIKETLTFDKHWSAMQNAEDGDQFVDAVSNFLGTACQPEVLGAVGSSVLQYFDDNPAAFGACKSTGKATYGATSMAEAGNTSEHSIVKRGVDSAANYFLMMDEKNEIDRLNRVISEDGSQNKLESKIRDVIDNMEKELKEMNEVYLQLQTGISSDSD